MDAVDLHAHLLHDLDAVAEREDHAFLCGAQQVGAAVAVEIQAMETAACIFVLQHALGSVAERQDGEAVSADRGLGRQLVHGGVGEALGHYVAAHPGIQDAGAVDAEQDAQTGVFGRMVHMRKGIDPRQRVVGHLPDDTVDHAGSAGGGSDLAGIQHIEAQCVVWLVAGPVGDRGAGRQAEFPGGCRADTALVPEGGDDVREQGFIEAHDPQQALGRRILLEIPENAFRQAADGRGGFAGQAKGYVIARQHDFPDLFIDRRLVFLDPGQFGRREIAR